MYMHEFHDHTIYSEGEIAFLVKMDFWPLWPLHDPLTPNWSCQKCAFADLLLWSSMGMISHRVSEILTCWQIEEEEERGTRSVNRSGHSRSCDPKWPQIDIWPHNVGRESQADQQVWVLWSCYVTWTSHSILVKNDLLTPVTPNDPGLTSDPIT